MSPGERVPSIPRRMPMMADTNKVPPTAAESTARVFQVYRTAAQQPNLALRVALLVFLVVIGLPILALLLFAIFAAALVFMLLSLVTICINGTKRIFSGSSDGRENVRVINRSSGDQTGS